METEGDISSFYIVLRDVLDGHKPIETLFGHPEFRWRAGRLCRRLAGEEGWADLFHEACLRALKLKGPRDPDDVRSADDFFKWFFAVARQTHLSRARRKADAERCIDTPGRWPATLAAVTPDEMDALLDHADACPYHAMTLNADEEKLRDLFLKAGGLGGRGRLLRGDELRAAIAEHRRRARVWGEKPPGEGLPFRHIALCNDGKEIAKCSEFYVFAKHISSNELNPRAGLQIRGIGMSGQDGDDVLLGYYALAGVRHDGKEKTIPLDNGYTVGLSIRKITEMNYEVHFRCVKNETIEQESAAAGGEASGGVRDGATGVVKTDLASGGGARPWAVGWLARIANRPDAAVHASLASCVVILMCVLMVRGSGRAEYAAAPELKPGSQPLADTEELLKHPDSLRLAYKLARLLSEQGFTYADAAALSRPTPGPATGRFAKAGPAQNRPAFRRDGLHDPRDIKIPAVIDDLRDEDLAAIDRFLRATARGDSAGWRSLNRSPHDANAGVATATRGGLKALVDSESLLRRRAARLLLSPEGGQRVRWLGDDPQPRQTRASHAPGAHEARVKYSWQLQSFADRAELTHGSVIHTGTDPLLRDAVRRIIEEKGVRVEPDVMSYAVPTKFEIKWAAYRLTSVERGQPVVVVRAAVFDGHREITEGWSQPVEAGDLGRAYEAAVKDVASSKVSILDPSRQPLGASEEKRCQSCHLADSSALPQTLTEPAKAENVLANPGNEKGPRPGGGAGNNTADHVRAGCEDVD